MKYKSLLVLALIMVASVTNAQDVIVTMDGQKIDAKILEVSKSEIKYKEKDYLDGPTFVLETAEISSIIYGNGKVVSYISKQEAAGIPDQDVIKKSEITKQENEDLYVGLQGKERAALVDYLRGYPKNIVAIKGDYSMLFNKRCKVYLDFDYDKAEKVMYNYEAFGCSEMGDFNQYLQEQAIYIDKQAILQQTCKMFNQKMISKKCELLPITDLNAGISDNSEAYKMILHVQRIDVGVGVVGVMAGGQTTTGGAIIYGNIEIKQIATDSLCSVLIVDRVQGIGGPYENTRIQRAIEEIISNKLFFIKNYKLYSKY